MLLVKIKLGVTLQNLLLYSCEEKKKKKHARGIYQENFVSSSHDLVKNFNIIYRVNAHKVAYLEI